MALIRPPLSEVVEAIRSDADAILGGVDGRLQRGLVEVVLLAQSGGLHGAYGFLQQIADDTFADTATSEALERLASIRGISRGAATFAKGWVGDTGAVPTVGQIPAGTLFRRGDGVEFEVVYGQTVMPDESTQNITEPQNDSIIGLGGTGWVVPVVAIESGVDGNTLDGVSVTFVSPVAGLSPIVSVRLGITGAVDFQSDDSLRAELLLKIRNPPQGGTKAEYESWALEASTSDDPITRAFIFPPAAGSNVVDVFIVDDGGGIPSANPPTPSAQAITNAETLIDARRPLSSDRDVKAPTFVAMTMTIALSPDTPETRVAIENEIDTFLFDNHEPGQEIPVSIMQAVVSNGAGGADAQITVPTVNWTPAPTELLYRGLITWV